MTDKTFLADEDTGHHIFMCDANTMKSMSFSEVFVNPHERPSEDELHLILDWWVDKQGEAPVKLIVGSVPVGTTFEGQVAIRQAATVEYYGTTKGTA